MYWRVEFYVTMTMSTCDDILQATHVLVRGKPGNIDCCKLHDLTAKISGMLPELKLHTSTRHLNDQPYFVSFTLAKKDTSQ